MLPRSSTTNSMTMPPLTTADELNHPLPRQQRYDWSLRRVRWLDVIKYQHWGGLLLFIPAVVLTAVSHYTFQERPVVRQALIYDATISYHTKPEQTVPNSLAVVYNWICMVLAAIVIELLLLRKQQSLTIAITGLIHQLWCCAINFVIIVAIVEITKPFTGRLRPDFLARCQPSATAGDDTLGPLHLGQVTGDCTNKDWETVKDGRLSFPSGHASNSMSLAWFTTFYVIWSMYLRHDAPYPGRLRATESQRMGLMRHITTRLVQELWHALVYAFVLLALCLSWFIGLTRVWDNVHNVSDILGGTLVAIIFTTPFAIKAIGLHTCIRHLIDGDDRDVLPVAHDGIGGGGGAAAANGGGRKRAAGRPQHAQAGGVVVSLPPAGAAAVPAGGSSSSSSRV